MNRMFIELADSCTEHSDFGAHRGRQMIRLNRIFGKKAGGDPEPPQAQAPVAAAPGIEDPLFAQRLHRAVKMPEVVRAEPLQNFSADDPETTLGEWDQTLADADLLKQEMALADPSPPIAPAPRPTDPAPRAVVPQPAPDQPSGLLTPEQRATMAQQQLAAARLSGHPTVAPALTVDLSNADLPTPERTGRRAGRVKTRLLGFEAAQDLTDDPIETAKAVGPAGPARFPAGWIVVIRGPGRGAFFPILTGVSQIGRGEDQAIKLDFGDGSISRNNHAAIAYDDEHNSFYLGHGGKTNIIRLNDRPVISTEPLNHQDQIRIGETTLLFVALCGAAFHWGPNADGPQDFG